MDAGTARLRAAVNPRALAATIACLAALGLAACGGDDDATTGASTTDTTGVSSTQPATTTSVDESSLPNAGTLREQFNEQLLQILTTTQGLDEETAQCAIDQLEARISDEQIRQAIIDSAQTGEPPQDLIDEAFDAGAECAKK